MALAIFDLDNTLIAGDSDHGFGEFLVRRGLVDAASHRAANERFYRDYQAGRLDAEAYLAFALDPLTRLQPAELEALRRDFVAEVVEQWWLPAAAELLARHRRRGDFLLVITSTHRFVAEPICERLGVDDLIASEPERIDGRFTGRLVAEPAYREGKVRRLARWLAEHRRDLAGSHGYSDSINDLPLLEAVEHPVAVDPDPRLAAEAASRGWPVISLRG